MNKPAARESTQLLQPLRAELFSTEQLEQHAKQLSQSHQLIYERKSEKLLAQLSENADILQKAHQLLQANAAANKEIASSGIWLLDNYYLIEEQIQLAKKYLPKNFSRSLPRLSSGKMAGFPRIYFLATELISHTDSFVNQKSLLAFFEAYQQNSALTLGELWALPVMLRLALIENLKRIAAGIIKDVEDTELAEFWAGKMIQKVEQNPRELVLVIAEMAAGQPPLNSAFIAEFTRRLQWKGPSVNLALTWIEQCTQENGHSVSNIILHSNQQKAADQVSMSNCINSLRFIAKIDWRQIVEELSITDRILAEDPAGVYRQMDFETRNRYRSTVEDLARYSHWSEPEVARRVIDFATAASDEQKRHIGYHLLGRGIKKLRTALAVRYPVNRRRDIWIKEQAGSIYFLLTGGLTFLAFAIMLAGIETGSFGLPLTVLLCFLFLLAGSAFAVAVANWVMTMRISPEPLPKMDFSKSIPAHAKTLVAVPTMLASKSQVADMVEALEIRYLANNDPHLCFALVTDFLDAAEEVTGEDRELLKFAANGIRTLNARYRYNGDEKFFLFHRPRKWNPTEGVWMGYERKRGKLGDLNKLLRGEETAFMLIVGKKASYSDIRYVITLDSDTQLPRESAWKMVGIMAHPLNKPVLNSHGTRVKEGYGIIQPRIAISLNLTNRTYFSRLHENDAGIDPYTRVTSDLYQDIFQQGSFIGKGIYEVDVFEKVLSERFPENRILSHDLLEGSYVRCGYASDVQLYEEYPSSYENDMSRRHRWIRGDWQISIWTLPFVPDKGFRPRWNPVNLLSRWKIFDNLRRSLVPVAFTTLFMLGWMLFDRPLISTLVFAGLLLLPPFAFSFYGILRKSEDITWNKHFRNSFRGIAQSMVLAVFNLICLPYEAYISLHAISTSLWRLLITGRKLLEWNPFGLVSFKSKNATQVYFKMWAGPALGIFALLWLAISDWLSLFIAAPFLISWIVAPALVWGLNQPLSRNKALLLNEKERKDLRVLARKTWGYFENLVGPQSNWLPPDNLQVEPKTEVAQRTSPTNIGMMFLSNLSAVDFGFTTLSDLLEKTTASFSTLGKMERLNGHFFNWYDIQSLQPLRPRYISTVDSGNMGGHLLTFRQGLLELIHQAPINAAHAEGLLDTLKIILKLLPVSKDENKAFYLQSKELLTGSGSFKLSAFYHSLMELKEKVNYLTENLGIQKDCDLLIWMERLDIQLSRLFKAAERYAPWINAPCSETLQPVLQTLESLTLEQLAEADIRLNAQAALLTRLTDEDLQQLLLLKDMAHNVAKAAQEEIQTIHRLSSQAWGFAEMAYDFLYDKSSRMLCLGYNADEHMVEKSHYDLLASEARLTIFLAIAQGKIPQESWFALGRRLTTVNNEPVLISWSGSMFEYLMPMLVMPSYQNTLLNLTMNGCVEKQMEYGNEHAVPWGISESCYNTLDSNLIYQYKAFGVPGLGFKKGLGQELVIAPYATVMALMVKPKEAYENILRMKKRGFEGVYGFFEAVDFTSSRLPKGKNEELIKTFMAHHQGMSLLSLAYLLLNQPMQRRFEKDPQMSTAILLLQERIPRTTGLYAGSPEAEKKQEISQRAVLNIFHTPHTENPEVQLLSNGNMHSMITNSGGGYTHWKGIALNRWREDATQDSHGTFCYIRNLNTGDFWSNTYHPTRTEPEFYAADFSHGKIDFHRKDKGIETHTEIIISPEDDVEIRRITLHNMNSESVLIEITSYFEVVMADPASDNHHSAFSNLFVQTMIDEKNQAIYCHRRPRAHEAQPWMFHSMMITNGAIKQISYETSRANFIGRGHSVAHPQALKETERLSDTQGSVLDPVAAIRKVFLINPRKKVAIDLITGIGTEKENVDKLLLKYKEKHFRDRAFDLSWTHNQVVLHQINAENDDAEIFSKLAAPILFANRNFRASEHILMQNLKGQSSLWSYSISGDLPIVLLKISDAEHLKLARQLVQAMNFLDQKGIRADLVIINEDFTHYRQELNEKIQELIAARIQRYGSKSGSVFVRQADQMPAEDLILLQSVARIIISDKQGSLEEQISRRFIPANNTRKLKPSLQISYPTVQVPVPEDLQFFNAYGGFSKDGREYVIITDEARKTPLPWVNVISNPHIGTVVSEQGASYTFVENAYGFRLTPWHNDPVNDFTGEAYYLRDEETGKYWSPAPAPAGGSGRYITRHGFGYSVIEHRQEGIHTEMCIYVDHQHAIKFVSIKVKNEIGKARRLTLTGYVEWVLSNLRTNSLMHVVTDIEPETGAFIARNSFNPEFPGRVAFFDTDEPVYSFTCDRKEFIGRNRTLSRPKAMELMNFSNTKGAGYDPCTALQLYLELETGEEKEVVFRMGSGRDKEEALFLLRMFKGQQTARESLEQVKTFWQSTLSSISIKTPDPALNLLTNGWLLYQTTSSRLWGKTGFYQSGGAFGYRDQLQDVLALLHTRPQIARSHILLAASRQFREGDVQHWWHPPLGRGVRTMCSDDYLWLAYVTVRYLETTGDYSILDEEANFLEGRLLNEGEESYYDMPVISYLRASLYEHCKLAIRRGMRYGKNGLPLMGSGDWNDGMNLVGIEGKGESVWLGFFLYKVLMRFEIIARKKDDHSFAEECTAQAAILKANIHANGWDGYWYLRAFFDNGTPLGSSVNEECAIDSITQSWSVLSDGGDPHRSQMALQQAYRQLVDKRRGLIKLLHPPFSKSEPDPGYIRSYVPGVRENGGQYTHAAIWLIMAFAKMGERGKVWELLQLINPVTHAKSEEEVSVYKVEPYVVAADVYGIEPHTGRGGWTWYTGSASWMYQLITEHFLGLKRMQNQLHFHPAVPEQWDGYEVTYTYLATRYHIVFKRSNAVNDNIITLDGTELAEPWLILINDGADHRVEVLYK